MVSEHELDGPTWVVGVDGSENSQLALRWAAHHAPGRAANLRVVRAWSVPIAGGLAVPQANVDDFRPETADESLVRLTAELAPRGVAVEDAIVYGTPVTVLLDACEGADLLVLGTRGLGGFSRLLLGSTSQQCATHAPIPVVVVPGGTSGDSDIEEIAVGMDGSAGARAALAWALGFAAPDVVVRVVSAWTSAIGTDLDDRPVETQEALAEVHAAVDEVEQDRAMPGRSVRTLVEGHAAAVLLDAMSTADLLVVGERGRRGLAAALLGSITTEVLHRADRPVVVVPTGH